MKFRPARPLNSRILTSCILPSLMHSARRSRGIFTRAATLAIGLCFTASLVSAQSVPLATPRATPAPLGSFVSDSAIPTLISPSEFRSEYFVLNKDFSLLTHSSIDSSLNGTCAAPSGFDASSSTPRTFLNDTQNAYFTGQLSGNADAGVSGFSFVNTGLCQPINGPSIAGGAPAYTLTSNDRYHAKLYVLSAFNGTGPDTLTVEVNLNHASSGGNYVTKLSTIPLDTGAQYTSLVTDTLGASSGVSLTAITELKTATSPGNLWIYNQERGTTYKILGPGGAPLPAVTSFIIPTQTNGGGNLLVLVNQDNLTSANLANPPLETTPFTIIDLGQLIQAFSVETFGGTITLPFVTQIGATTPYFAMLGAAYDPVTRLVYAVVGGGSASGVTGNVISYDPFNPASPNETVVADISNIPFSFESYPQLALSAAAGTLQILTPSPSALYTVGILGTGNTAVSVPGSIFPDVSFQPTFIAANALLGETYIASASGQVDVLTNASAKPLATFTLNGNDIATTSQSYNLQATALYAVDDTALRAASVTVTATPQGSSGSAFTVAAGSFTNFAATPGNIPITLPTLGVYTLVASIPATANYPAITSNPINVTVASNFIAGVYPTALSITAPANPPTTAVNTLVTLSGSTYAPTGYINVSDANGNIVGTTYFNGGPLVQPTSVAITLVQGSNTLTASYSGDAQNAASTSPPLTVSVGTQVTPGLAITVASPATAGSSVTGNVKFTSTTANVPTGSVTVYGMLAGSTTRTTLATITAAQAFTSSGASYSFTAPAAGTYQVSASYAGDANYATATSGSTSLVVNAAVALDTTLTVTPPASATTNLVFKINIKLASATSTQTPTGNINVTAQLAGSTTSTNIGMIDPSQAYASGGTNLTAQFPTAGAWTITASYIGDQNFRPSTGTAMLTVSPAVTDATTLKITAPANVTVNTPYTALVKLTAASSLTNGPSGLVTLVVTSSTGAIVSTINTTAASAFLGNGYSASVPAATASGTYTLTASYAGDTNYSASSTTSTVTAGSTLDTASLGISGPTNVTTGGTSPVTIRLAAQTGATATPTGNITITTTNPSGVTATIGTITAAQALASGGDVAEIQYTLVGNFTVTVNYAGDANFSGSTASLVVTVANIVVTPTTIGISGSTTQIAGIAFPLTVKLAVQGTSQVAPTGNVVLTGVLASSGTTLTLATLTTAQALTSGGFQTQITLPSAGMYSVTATYSGDANFGRSSGGLVIGASSVSTTTSVTIDVPDVTLGQALTTVVKLASASNATPAPTGSVVVTTTLGGVTTATKTLSAAAAESGASTTSTPQTVGVYTITATYSGDASHLSSSSSLAVTVSALPIPSVMLTGSPQGIVATPVAVAVRLLGSAGTRIVSTGLVTVTSTLNGQSGPSVTFPASSTSATLTFPTFGEYELVASFAGDSTYGPARSDTYDNYFYVKVYTAATLPGFTLQTQDPTLTVNSPPIHIPYTGQIPVPMFTSSVNGLGGELDLKVTAVLTNVDNSTLSSSLNGDAATIKTQILDARGRNIGFDEAIIDVGDHFSVVVDGSLPRNGFNRYPMARNSGVLACFLLGMFCLRSRLRKGTRGALKGFAALFLIACLGTLTPGCGTVPHAYTITATAISSDTGLTRTVSFQIIQDPAP